MKTITFCKAKCCPTVTINDTNVILGDAEGAEGITTWTKNQFKDFIEAAKEGKFDEILEKN